MKISYMIEQIRECLDDIERSNEKNSNKNLIKENRELDKDNEALQREINKQEKELEGLRYRVAKQGLAIGKLMNTIQRLKGEK